MQLKSQAQLGLKIVQPRRTCLESSSQHRPRHPVRRLPPLLPKPRKRLADLACAISLSGVDADPPAPMRAGDVYYYHHNPARAHSHEPRIGRSGPSSYSAVSPLEGLRAPSSNPHAHGASRPTPHWRLPYVVLEFDKSKALVGKGGREGGGVLKARSRILSCAPACRAPLLSSVRGLCQLHARRT
ncbi:hypothetical protein DFH11DRAFT_1877086 [Phellopilus nigrolimitatus]|nr:hypothetical protein DFH11DRAFT_1877086 [Phellopilus nigrolimitatus]